MGTGDRYNLDTICDKADRFDYLISIFSGSIAGLIDIFLVGKPNSILDGWSDRQIDEFVMKFAGMNGWNPRPEQANNVASAIGFMERNALHKINYDQAKGADVNNLFKMTPKNHHIKSLGHSPDIVGLCFSVLDQFQGKSSFLDNGCLIRIDTATQELRGSNLIAKLFCGISNWAWHIVSDMAGSTGSRRDIGKRGSGVPIPFFEMFLLCDSGKFQIAEDRQNFSILMTRVFQEGYDLRHGISMSVPVAFTELTIRLLWSVKCYFYHRYPLERCIPSDKYESFRVCLLVGTATLCAIDGLDAAIRSGGNCLLFVLRLNLIAWLRLLWLVFKELNIRFGMGYQELYKEYSRIHQEVNAYLDRLRKIDFEFYQLETQDLSDISALLEGERWDESVGHICDFLVERGREVQFHSSEELEEKMEDADFTLKF